MRILALAVLVSTLIGRSAAAQPAPDTATRDALRWSDHRVAADWIGTGLVAAALALPCLSDRRWACVKVEAVQVGLGVAAAELTKRIVHRRRPDGSDRVSFFSEHTTLACVASIHTRGWALCPAVGYMRIAADKHWLTDVGTGALAGAALAHVSW